jgi:hypothetical protein
MSQERVPGLASDGATLTAVEQAAMAGIARRIAVEDPQYADRLSRFGGYEVSPLGMPSRWAALPVAIIGAILAFGVLFVVFVVDGGADGAGSTHQTQMHLPK